MKREAIFPGSFDPFTNGHLDIVKKAAALFDHVYVIVGVNVEKHRAYDPEAMRSAIERTLSEEMLENCTAVIHSGLTVDFMKSHGIRYMVRGLRGAADYEYEETAAGVNALLYPEIEYVYLRADEKSLSSSMIRELRAHGADVSGFVPRAVCEVVEGH